MRRITRYDLLGLSEPDVVARLGPAPVEMAATWTYPQPADARLSSRARNTVVTFEGGRVVAAIVEEQVGYVVGR